MKMSFDGRVGDMGSSPVNVCTYEMGYVGEDINGMEKFLRKKVKKYGLELLSIRREQERGGKWKVVGMVRSDKGII